LIQIKQIKAASNSSTRATCSRGLQSLAGAAGGARRAAARREAHTHLLSYSTIRFGYHFFNDLPLDRVGGISEAGFSLPGGLMLGGLGAFILAEVFAFGLQLREDVEGTV
jgi:hypothetical protein